MKKIWFKRKLYGYGWTPATWQGWSVILVYLALIVLIMSKIDELSHSAGETLAGVTIPIFVFTLMLVVVSWMTGEKGRWQWGKRIEEIEDVLLKGGIVVMPTDTTYGIVGSALNEKTVNEIYRLRKRDLDKPFIILISNMKDLKMFGVIPTPVQKEILRKVWPGPVSVVLGCNDNKFSYLHRGKETLAFRFQAKRELRILIDYVGPLVAPSANPQGHPVATTIDEAKAYFGSHVDLYQDGGKVAANPSRLIDITSGVERVIRA